MAKIKTARRYAKALFELALDTNALDRVGDDLRSLSSIIKESVIMPDATIGNNCLIEKAIVPCDVHVPDGTVIRSFDGEIVLVTSEMISGLYPAF